MEFNDGSASKPEEPSAQLVHHKMECSLSSTTYRAP